LQVSWLAFTEVSDCEAQVIRHLRRRHRFEGDLPLRQIAEKVIGITAVVMDHHSVISLLRQVLSEVVNLSAKTCTTNYVGMAQRTGTVQPGISVHMLVGYMRVSIDGEKLAAVGDPSVGV
jgi:hypothetical protein